MNAIIIADKDEVLCSSTEEIVTSLEAVNSDPNIKADILTEFYCAMKLLIREVPAGCDPGCNRHLQEEMFLHTPALWLAE